MLDVCVCGGYWLSIVLPAYNSEKWVDKAIKSVLSQETDYSYELIVIDDGSEDSTGEIVDKYSENPDVHIVHQENRGFSGARNAGIDMAAGEYIMFLDSDDILLPSSIQSLMKCAVENNADVVCGNFMRRYKNEECKQGTNYSFEKVKPLGKLYGQPWGKVYRRSLFDNLRFPEGYWYEDSIFSMIVWQQCKSAYTIPEYVYEYLMNEDGITVKSRKSPKSIDSLYVIRALLKDKSKFNLKIEDTDYNVFLRTAKLTYRRTCRLGSKVQKAIFVNQCELADLYFPDNNPDESLACFSKALKQHNYRVYLQECLRDYL